MIDVSSLTHLQAAILLLIDRRGSAGRRVCELVREIDADERSIRRILSHLTSLGLVVRIVGDAHRFLTPESVTRTPESVTRTPESATRTPESATRTPESPSFSPFCVESVQENINSNIKKKERVSSQW